MPSCIPSHGPFGEFLSSVESVQLSQLLPCVIFFYLVFFGHITATGCYVPSALPMSESSRFDGSNEWIQWIQSIQ
jgi:hypothetical protein